MEFRMLLPFKMARSERWPPTGCLEFGNRFRACTLLKSEPKNRRFPSPSSALSGARRAIWIAARRFSRAWRSILAMMIVLQQCYFVNYFISLLPRQWWLCRGVWTLKSIVFLFSLIPATTLRDVEPLKVAFCPRRPLRKRRTRREKSVQGVFLTRAGVWIVDEWSIRFSSIFGREQFWEWWWKMLEGSSPSGAVQPFLTEEKLDLWSISTSRDRELVL